MPTKTQRERHDEARKEKLEQIEEQIKAGTLVVRQMTDKERAKYKRRDTEPSSAPARPRRRRTRQARSDSG